MKRITLLLVLLFSSPVYADFVMTKEHCDTYMEYVNRLYVQRDNGVTQSDAYRDVAKWIIASPDAYHIDIFPMVLTWVDMVYTGDDPQPRAQRLATQTKHCNGWIGKNVH